MNSDFKWARLYLIWGLLTLASCDRFENYGRSNPCVQEANPSQIGCNGQDGGIDGGLDGGNGDISIDSDITNEDIESDITGDVKPDLPNYAILTISGEEPFDFGAVPTGNTSGWTFTVTNGGKVPATYINFNNLSLPFELSWENCLYEISNSCEFSVVFAPFLDGVRTYTIALSYYNGFGPAEVIRGVQGSGQFFWAQVSTGAHQTCAINLAKTAWCWGSNSRGQLGIEETDEIWVPTQIINGTDWLSISTGCAHTCGIKSDQSLWCWGWNEYGRLGDGTAENRNQPTQVLVPAYSTD